MHDQIDIVDNQDKLNPSLNDFWIGDLYPRKSIYHTRSPSADMVKAKTESMSASNFCIRKRM